MSSPEAATVNVLHIDDNQLDRALVRDALMREHAGFSLTEAASPADLAAHLARHDLDLVLTDINILGYSGLQVVDQVRQQRPGLPVIVVTGTGSEQTAIEAMRRGVADYVIKSPHHLHRLPQTIQSVLKQQRLLRDKERADEELRRFSAELEQRVADRTRQLQETLDELDAFAYSVSHDLRAPLRAIDGFARRIEAQHGPALPPDARNDLGRVREATGHMARMIDAMLALSRVNQAQLRSQPVDLSQIASAAVQRLRQAEPARQVQVEIAPDLRAAGDPALLEIALQNLLENAWKFTAYEAAPRISFDGETRPEPAGERVFVVRDNGAGFDPQYAQNLFLPFRRLHTQERFPGMGVGLATVRRVVQRHGGLVWAESAPGQGAAFFFTLPGA